MPAFSARVARLCLAALIVLLIAPAAVHARRPKQFRVALVVDGPSDRIQQVIAILGPETDALMQTDVPSFAFPKAPTHTGDFTAAGAERALDAALTDPAVDVLLVFGVALRHAVAQRASLAKPVIMPIAFPRVDGLPADGNQSGRANVSYISGLLDVREEMTKFHDLAGVSQVAVFLDPALVEALAPKKAELGVLLAGTGVTATLHPYGETAQATLAAIPADADGVYLGLAQQLPVAEEAPLLAGLKARKLPSFAMLGPDWVKKGAMLSLTDDGDWIRRARRTALFIQRVWEGDDPGTFPIDFEPRSKLTLNVATAVAVGAYPRFEVLTEADLIDAEALNQGGALTLKEAVEGALAANLALRSARVGLEITREGVNTARGSLLPQLDAGAQYLEIDPDIANPQGNAQRTIKWTAELSQVLFSAQGFAEVDAQKLLVVAAEHDLESARLDTIQAATDAYLNVLRAKVGLDIQRDNLALARTNLELARVRLQIGSAGPEEAARWESQVANARASVLDAGSSLRQSMLAVNQALNRPLGEQFMPVTDDAELFALLRFDPRVQSMVDNPWVFERFSDFMVAETFGQQPTLQALAANLETQRARLSGLEWSYWIPTAAAFAGLTDILWTGGEASEPTPLSPGAPPFERDEFNYQFGVNLTFPLYDGSARYAQARQLSRGIEQLEVETTQLRQRVEQQVRAALWALVSAAPAVDLRRAAAEAAEENLRVVTANYQSGRVAIITLIDAQNQVVSARLAAANAKYDLVQRFVAMERATGRYSFEASPEARVAWLARLTAHLAAHQPGAAPTEEGSR